MVHTPAIQWLIRESSVENPGSHQYLAEKRATTVPIWRHAARAKLLRLMVGTGGAFRGFGRIGLHLALSDFLELRITTPHPKT